MQRLIMTEITKEEVLKIAKMTKLVIEQDELESTVKQLQDVLGYAIRVQDIAKDVDIPSNKNINSDREDVVVTSHAQQILQQAPDQQDNYFVVPKILDN